jgi:hypothetical protein
MSRTTGAPSTTIGVLLRKHDTRPIAAISIQIPAAPARLHIATPAWIARSRRPESSSA